MLKDDYCEMLEMRRQERGLTWMIRLFILEPQEILRMGLTTVISQDEEIEIVALRQRQLKQS